MTESTQHKSATLIRFPCERRITHQTTVAQIYRMFGKKGANQNKPFRMKPKTPWGTRP